MGKARDQKAAMEQQANGVEAPNSRGAKPGKPCKNWVSQNTIR
jgi:hypothetical protein